MAKPIKFKSTKKFKLMNKCVFCRKVIPITKTICNDCKKKIKN